MKKLIVGIMVFTVILSAFTAVSVEAKVFTDVSRDAWYYNDVMGAVDLGIINGKTESTFAPNDNMTYAEAIKIAACMHQISKDGKVKAVSGGNPWYQVYVDYCESAEIITKKYDYNEPATREGYMEIFAKAIPKSELLSVNNVPDGAIPDVPADHPYAEAIYTLYRAGILAGVDAEHNCNPESTIKRSEVAAIITRMMDKNARVKFSMGEEKAPGLEIPEDAKPVEPETPVEEVDTPDNYPPFRIVSQPKTISGAEEDELLQYTVKVEGGKAPYTYSWCTRYRKERLEINESDVVVGTKKDTISMLYNINNPLSDSAFCCVIKDSLGQTLYSDYVKMPEPPFVMNIEQMQTVKGQTLFSGRVERGSLKVGDYVVVRLTNKDVFGGGVISNIIMFNKNLDEASAGDYCGIVFEELDSLLPLEFLRNSYSSRFVDSLFEKDGFAVKLPLNAMIKGNPVADMGYGVRFETYVAGGKAPYTYQWQVINLSISNPEYTNVVWVDNSTPNIEYQTAEIEYVCDRYFHCIVTDAEGNQVTTNEAHVFPSHSIYIVITQHTFYADHGDDVEMQVKLKAPANEVLSYQWQYKLSGHKDFKNIEAADTWAKNFNTDTLTVHVENADFKDDITYRCLVTGKNVSFTTDDYKILPDKVVIAKQPENVKGKDTEKVQFKVEAKGKNGPLTYQWLIQAPNNEIPVMITDAFLWAEGQYTDTLTVYVDAEKLTSDYKFSCLVTDANGNRVYSKEANVIVMPY